MKDHHLFVTLLPGTLLVLALTVHLLYDIERHWRFAYLVYNWAPPNAFFYSDILWHLLGNLEKAFVVTNLDQCRTCNQCQKDGSV